jgi:hypothetical protein
MATRFQTAPEFFTGMPAVVIFGDAPLPTTGSMGFSAPPPLLFFFLDAAVLFFLPPPAALPQPHFEAFFSGMNRIYCPERIPKK